MPNEAARVLDYLGWRPDLVYIDASHDALDVIQDLEHFYRLLRCGGMLVGDDYHWKQVAIAVDWFARRRNLHLSVYEIFGGNQKGPRSSERAVRVRSGPAPSEWALGPMFVGEQNSETSRAVSSKWTIEKRCA